MRKRLGMPYCLFLVVLSACSNEGTVNIKVELQDIRNFSKISQRLASSGMPSEHEISIIKKNGYKHIISLLPGDQNKERSQVKAINLTFDQVPVEWGDPKLEDFEKFVSLMDTYGEDKVLVHCALNYRASAFSYLYQVTQKLKNQDAAEKKFHTIWEPNDEWFDFINMVEKHYKLKK